MKKGDLVEHVYNGKYGVVIALKPIDFSTDINYQHKIWNVLVWWAETRHLNRSNWVPLPNLKVIEHSSTKLL